MINRGSFSTTCIIAIVTCLWSNDPLFWIHLFSHLLNKWHCSFLYKYSVFSALSKKHKKQNKTKPPPPRKKTTKNQAQSLRQGNTIKVTQKLKCDNMKSRLYSKTNEDNPTRVDKKEITRWIENWLIKITNSSTVTTRQIQTKFNRECKSIPLFN